MYNIYSYVWRFFTYLKRIPSRIGMVFAWIPVVWNDYDWDSQAIYEILRYKLKRMEKMFRSDKAMGLTSKREADNMHKCILLLDRLISDDYYKASGLDKVERKWGELEIKTRPTIYRGKKTFAVDVFSSKAETGKDREQADYERLRCYRREDQLRDQDHKYLFKLLSKHLRSWWD